MNKKKLFLTLLFSSSSIYATGGEEDKGGPLLQHMNIDEEVQRIKNVFFPQDIQIIARAISRENTEIKKKEKSEQIVKIIVESQNKKNEIIKLYELIKNYWKDTAPYINQYRKKLLNRLIEEFDILQHELDKQFNPVKNSV